MPRVVFALLFGCITAAIADAQSLVEAAAQLAVRISSQLPRRATVSLAVQDLTATSPVDSSSFRRVLEDELRKAELQITTTPLETRVRVSISENARALLLVAEMFSGENRAVVMLPWTAPPAAENKPRLKIIRRPVWEQADPVLDVLLLNSESELLVLSPAAVSSFHLTDGKWTLTGAAPLSLARLPARDSRGRLQSAPGGFRVYVPGTTCSGTIQPVLKLSCTPGNEPWPANSRDASFTARWLTDRNVLESAGFQGAFYAAAGGWFSTLDHRIVDRAGEPLALPELVGSDLATLESPCVANPILLASDAADSPDHDHARVYEIASGRAIAASEPAALPGPVTALWPAETPGQVTLVVQNSKTGNYEAGRLGVACAE